MTIQLIHQSIAYRLEREDVILPGGEETFWDIVRHRGAACAFAVDQGDLIMIRNWRPALNRYLLEIPGGLLEPGEDPLMTAQRELREEAGFTATDWLDLGKWYYVQGFSDFRLHHYFATGLAPAARALDQHERIDVERVALMEVARMARTNELVDAQVTVALGLAMLHGLITL